MSFVDTGSLSADVAEVHAGVPPSIATTPPVISSADLSAESADDCTVDSVNAINSTIHRHQQLTLTRSRLGRLGDMATPARHTANRGPLVRSVTPPDPSRAMFPTGCRTRRIDGSGRIKLQMKMMSLFETLGWVDGAPDVTVTDSWAVLTQRRELAPAPRRRNSCHAGFSVHDTTERIALRPTHLRLLGLSPGDEALIEHLSR